MAALLALMVPARADFRDVLDATRMGDMGRVESLLASGSSPNPPEYHRGYVPLQFAAGNGNIELTRLLLDAGADTEARDHNGERALLWAAQNGALGTARLLLDAGSPPDSDADPYGATPAMRAILYGHIDLVELLLDAGADATRLEQGGEALLNYAARLDDPRAAEIAIRAGGDVNLADDILYRTPLHQAAMWASGETADVLIAAAADLEPRDYEGLTPLHLAAVSGNVAVLRALIAAGADPDATGRDGLTPILAALASPVGPGYGRDVAAIVLAGVTGDVDRAFAQALWHNQPRAAFALLDRDADANAVDADGRSALAASVRQPGRTWYQLLLIRGADLGRHGTETLIEAAEADRADLVADLIERGVGIEGRDTAGATALMQAAMAGAVDAVRLLLALGADPEVVDGDGRSIGDYLTIRPSQIQGEIDTRNMSRAYRPTAELEAMLADLNRRHAEIRALLGLG